MTRRIVAVILLGGILSVAGASAQEIMTLDDYLTRVEGNNPEIKAVELSIDAMSKKSLELDLVYSPLLTGSYAHVDDRSGGGVGSTFSADRIQANSWNANLAKRFRTGTTASLIYGYSDAALSGALGVPGFPGNFAGYDLKPYVQIQQSLLRDLGSGLTEAGIRKTKASVRSGQYLQLLRRQQLLLRAKSSYWALSLAREVVAFRKTSLDRTEKLLRWNERRVALDLADRSDLYQAQAAYKLRQLNLQQALEDEVRANRDFNEILGTNSDAADVALERLSDKISAYSSLQAFAATGKRADVLSAEAAYQSSEYANRETYYRSMPELSAFGTYSLHGLSFAGTTDAWQQVLDTEKPAYTVGVSFAVPLDFGTLVKVREGYRKDYDAAKETLAQTRISARADWENLSRTWTDVKTRLALAQEIKDIQDKRVANEQNRFEKGRTTTFNLITAENDLDDATLNVYRLVYEELMTAAQSELYNTAAVFGEGK